MPQHIKVLCNKPTANVTLIGEELKVFPQKSETKQGCPLSLFLFSTVLERATDKRDADMKGRSQSILSCT